MTAAFTVPTVLGIWICASFALARRAERRSNGLHFAPSPQALATAIAIALTAMRLRATPVSALACGFACIALVAAADSDARCGYLFDAITIPAAVITTSVSLAGGAGLDAILGILMLVATFGAIVFFSRGRAMGLGDVKGMIALGAAFGPFESVVAIFAACLCGIACSAMRGRLDRGTAVPFGPHLAAGGTFALIAGDSIAHRLLGPS